MAEKTVPKIKKGKKKEPQQGLDVVQNIVQGTNVSPQLDVASLMELPAFTDAELQEILSQPFSSTEYMQDETKPLHSNFLVPNKGKKSSCPVFSAQQEKQLVVDKLCSNIHQETLKQWGTLACFCGVVPRLKLSKTENNPNRVFVCCPKPQDLKCKFFQWIDKPPKPQKTSNANLLKKRFLEMVEEEVAAKKVKEEPQGGFNFIPVM